MHSDSLTMIGVIADSAEHEVVREFFELFKTPWEFYRRDGQYDVVLCNGSNRFDGSAKLVVAYAGRSTSLDDDLRIQLGRQSTQPCILSHRGKRIPIYGNSITFPGPKGGFLIEEASREPVLHVGGSEEAVIRRIGYDLFGEVRRLLTVGQPAANAPIPTLELHIALLRDLIISCGIPLVEIPPVPDGYQFTVCLTHDIDHPSIRRHKWDHTSLGFLYRAVFGSLRNFMRGRMCMRDLVTNWGAAFRLPFVYLGFAKDFWCDFAERYLRLEKGLPSTFFVIPFKDHPGKNADRRQSKLRGANYSAQDIADSMRKLIAAGCELGLHGIDAWLDSAAGCGELDEIRRLTGVREIGVRMHWLCYNQHSPAALEAAGAAYDSTTGYNETVGYRAGTTQAFKPLSTSHLLELPLHVMDTALFYPAYLDLSADQAMAVLNAMTENAIKLGGCFTINWHDRSTAPERLWGSLYRDLIEDLKNRGAWFATAGQAVAWFRKRRSVIFETDVIDADAIRARLPHDQYENLPGLRLRTHGSADAYASAGHPMGSLQDMVPERNSDTAFPCSVN